MLRAFLICLTLSTLITGCDTGYKKSDYLGGFATQSGNCTATGDTAINFSEQEVEIGFYCFLKKCAYMEGDTSQGGFFHLKSNDGYYIQGRVTRYEASGTWFLNMKGESCSGHWSALKN